MRSLGSIVGLVLVAVAAGCGAGLATVAPVPQGGTVVSGGAAISEKMSFEELVRHSDQIVVGWVVSSESAWNAEQTLIQTTVRVRVAEVVKGAMVDEVRLVVEGGQVGGVAQSGEGAVTFTEGEQVVLFLRRGAVVGGSQGVFRVMDGKVGGERLEVFLERVGATR